MGRPKKEESMEDQIAIEDMPLTSLREYRLYNEAARAANKRARKCVHPIKPCPVELHPHQRIVFQRNDQPSNPLQVFVSNDIIDFKKTLYPGQTYDLPEYIINYLGEKGTPVWKVKDMPDGSKDSFMSHKKPRFAIRTVYAS